MPNQDEKNNLFLSVEKQLLKTDLKLTEVVQDTNEIKNSVAKISSNITEIQKTLVIQSHQLGEHMRRTDALEKIVQQTKHDQNNYQLSSSNRITALESDKANAKEWRARDFAIIGIIVAIVDTVITFMGKK